MIETKEKILSIYEKYGINLRHVPIEERQNGPFYLVAEKKIILSPVAHKQQYALQLSHEYVHAYLDSPWTKESDTDWREEFIATLISLTICAELGDDFLAYALRCFSSIYNTTSQALSFFLLRTQSNYLQHPAQVYKDEICMPLLYFRQTRGANAWIELEQVRQYLTNKRTNTSL